jgi:hypothetical protein
MKSWSDANRLFVKIFIITLLITILAGTLYYFFGHFFIEKIYANRQSDLTGEPQSHQSLEQLIENIDRAVYTEILLFPILNLIFYFFLYKIFKYLLFNIREQPNNCPPGKQFRHDWLPATGFYLLCTYIFFQPYFSTISTALIGPAEDN